MQHWTKCKITGKEFNSFRGFCNHLRTLKLTSKEYYDTYHKTEDEGFCSECNAKTTYHSFAYKRYCSDACSNKSNSHRSAVANRFNVSDREEKLKAFRHKRGSVDSNRAKASLTMELNANKLGLTLDEYRHDIAKRGAQAVSHDDKRKQTIKANATRISKGYDKTVIRGNSYKELHINDIVIKCQGYEPPVIKHLVTMYHDTFKFGKANKFIDYHCSIKNKPRMYFPDAISDGIIIEVKSKFTFDSNKKNTLDKLKFSYLLGNKAILVLPTKVSNSKSELSDGFKKLLDWAISSQASMNGIYILEEGSTTILYGVGSSDPKCLKSFDDMKDCDIVWSEMKVSAVIESLPIAGMN